MFDWAKPKDRKASNVDNADLESRDGMTKLLPDTSDDEDSDDPIGNLLKSNTAVFSKSEELLKNGTLQYNKLSNANASSQH